MRDPRAPPNLGTWELPLAMSAKTVSGSGDWALGFRVISNDGPKAAGGTWRLLVSTMLVAVCWSLLPWATAEPTI